MKRRTHTPKGWVPLRVAAERMGMHRETLREHVLAGEFTRLRRTPGRTAAIYLPESEVKAFVRGGLAAVQGSHRGAPEPTGA